MKGNINLKHLVLEQTWRTRARESSFKFTTQTRLIIITLLIFNLGHHTSLALLIDSKAASVSNKEHTYCMGSGEPLQFSDPFDASLPKQDSFIAVTWYRIEADGGNLKHVLLTYREKSASSVTDGRFSPFEILGMELKNVRTDDSATYEAELFTADHSSRIKILIRVVVAIAPTLLSEGLTISKKSDGHVTVSCGQIDSLGMPRITLQLMTSGSQLLNTSYSDGYFLATLPKSDDDSEYSCDVAWDTSPAARCIPESDRLAWKGSVLLQSRESMGDITGIIAGAAAALIVIIIVIIVLVCVCRWRSKGGKAYSTKAEEAKMEAAHVDNSNNSKPLLEEGWQAPARTHNYKETNPYAVSDINLQDLKQAQRAPFAASEDSSSPATTPHSLPGGNNGKESKKPRTKPRSIFLTASMEALDTVGKA